MTTLTLPQPADTDTDDPLCHIYCCDPEWAICGASLSGVEDCWSPDCCDNDCPLCAAVVGTPCPRCGEIFTG